MLAGRYELPLLWAAPMGDAQKAHYRGTEDAARKLGLEIQMFAPRSIERFHWGERHPGP